MLENDKTLIHIIIYFLSNEFQVKIIKKINPLNAKPTKCETQSNNLSATGDEFESV